MEKGNIYFFDKIEEFAINNEFELLESGRTVIGEGLVTLIKDSGYGIAITFVMVGLAQFECVYSDQ